jgi:hypothetical protein
MIEWIDPVKPKNLTIKQRKFMRALIRCEGNATEAARQSLGRYPGSGKLSDKAAGALGHNMIKRLGISLGDLLDRAGLDMDRDIEDLKRLSRAQKENALGMLSDDNATQLKALELRLKLKGLLKDTKINIETNKTEKLVFQDIKIEGASFAELLRDVNNRLANQQTR